MAASLGEPQRARKCAGPACFTVMDTHDECTRRSPEQHGRAPRGGHQAHRPQTRAACCSRVRRRQRRARMAPDRRRPRPWARTLAILVPLASIGLVCLRIDSHRRDRQVHEFAKIWLIGLLMIVGWPACYPASRGAPSPAARSAEARRSRNRNPAMGRGVDRPDPVHAVVDRPR